MIDLEKALSRGQVWPPESDKPRQALYAQNELLYQGRHAEVYTILNKLYAASEEGAAKVITVLNWPRRLSKLWADLLFGEWPKIRSGKIGGPEDAYIRDLQVRVGLRAVAYQLAIDASRFGTGILKVYAREGEPSRVQAVHPKNWYPLGDGDHLIAWKQGDKLFFELHRPGLIESGYYGLTNDRIDSEVQDYTTLETGVSTPLVFPIHNLLATGEEFGSDDYRDLDPILKRLEITITRIGRILDAHSEPAFAVSMESVSRDPNTSEITFNPRTKVFPLNEGESPPQYITWDGQLSAAFNLVDRMMDQLYSLSETCRAAFEPDKIGSQLSGTALRLLMTNPLKKTERLKVSFDWQIKQALVACSELDAKHAVEGAVRLQNISITWFDGLPEDFSENVRNYSTLKVSGLVSTQLAVEKLYWLEGDELDAEIKAINQDLVGQLPGSELNG